MVFDRALADAEISGDVLARMPVHHKLHDLALARCQRSDQARRGLPPGVQFAGIARLLEGAGYLIRLVIRAEGLGVNFAIAKPPLRAQPTLGGRQPTKLK